MGLFNFKRKDEKRKMKQQLLTNGFRLINGYSPTFTTFSGGLYEMHLIRAAIETIATHASKLNPTIASPEYKHLEKILKERPNELMSMQQFISRVVTMLECDNNAFIIPIYADMSATKVIGLYPVLSRGSRVVQEGGQLYLIYKIENTTRAIEY